MELLIATTNNGKFNEFSKLLKPGPLALKLYSLSQMGITQRVAETGYSFLENAAEKSIFYSKLVGIPVMAEDSGLEVLILNGRPGIHSARYAGDNASDEKNIQKLLTDLQGIKNRQARFVSVISLAKRGKLLQSFRGLVDGEILEEKKGKNGFGFDPIFYYPTLKKTFAEISVDQKNSVSHRNRSVQQLKIYLKDNF